MIPFFFPDLHQRSFEPELMDDPECNDIQLINTVRQFKMLNFLFSGYRQLLKQYIIPDMMKEPANTYTLLDIGSGGCDIPYWLIRYCQKKHLKLQVTCLDNDSRIFLYVKQKFHQIPQLLIKQQSIFELPADEPFDYVFANHFLHHLTDEAILRVIPLIKNLTKRLFLLNDIFRSPAAYIGYTLFTGIFMHNSFAFYDGRLSIRRGFRENELENLIKKLNLQSAVQVNRCSPYRIYLAGTGKQDML